MWDDYDDYPEPDPDDWRDRMIDRAMDHGLKWDYYLKMGSRRAEYEANEDAQAIREQANA